MSKATLTISSKNYSAWSLRGWLLVRFSGLPFEEVHVSPDDADARAELLLLSPSFLVPKLTDGGIEIWDTLAIAEYLNERFPEAGLLPADPAARARCRSICGEMHSGFGAMRSSLPMNLQSRGARVRVWSRAQADIDRVTSIWRDCLEAHGGPFLFGARRSMADAMYAPVVTRFITYGIALDDACRAYCDTVMAMPEMIEWVAAAQREPANIEEFAMEF